MVACNHNRLDTCFAALCNSVLNLGTNGVNHTRKSYKGHIKLQCLGGVFRGSVVVLFICRRKNTESLVAHACVFRRNFFSYFIGHGYNLTAHNSVCAFFQNFVWSALCKLNNSIARLMNGGHHLSARIKGNLAYSGIFFAEHIFGKLQRFCIVDKCNLVRLTCAFAVFLHIGVCAKSHSNGKLFLVFGIMVNNSHYILCKSSRFVRTDNLRTAESFNRCHFTDNCVFL